MKENMKPGISLLVFALFASIVLNAALTPPYTN